MSPPQELCDCRYESVERPGLPVAPIILTPPLAWLPEVVGRYMEPLGLYRCLLCETCVYITLEAQALLFKHLPML